MQDKEDFGGVFAKIMVDKPEFIPIVSILYLAVDLLTLVGPFNLF